MNTNLLNIVKRIVDEQGEGILTDSKRLFPFFADYAKNELKEDRVAFGRCIEMGAYQELKKTHGADERRRIKAALTDQINAKTGIDRTRCAEALDLLEAVMFKPEPQNSPPSPQANVQASPQPNVKNKKSKLLVAIKIYVVLWVLTFILGQLTRQYGILPDADWLDILAIIVIIPLAIILIGAIFYIPVLLIKGKLKGVKNRGKLP